MASVKVKFRPSVIEGREGVIYYQVIHERVVRQIRTSYKIFINEWDETSSHVIISSQEVSRISYVSMVSERIKLDVSRLYNIIAAFDKKKCVYSSDDLVSLFEKHISGITLCNFMHGIIVRWVQLHKYRAAETYRTTLNSFMRFRGGEDLLLIDISTDMMMDYEVYLKMEGVAMNTSSFYMRTLRAVYNRAVENGIIEQKNPFKKVYTGIEKTVKRALLLKEIKKINALDLSYDKDLMFARDMFMFSFFTRGMSFIDIAYLRKKDMQNGIITYRRRKTGQRLCIKCEKCMQEILDRYSNSDSEYLLSIITSEHANERNRYRNRLGFVNNKLKEIGKMLGLSTTLTMYVARHSWASVAKNNNVPISIISEGMGHNSESTTQIYLASLDTSIVDKANRLILKLL